MTEGAYDEAVGRFSLLSHPARLRILDELRYGDACVCHLQHRLGRPQVYVSQQLGVLRQAGVVESYHEGTNVFYRLVDAEVRALLGLALGPVDASRPVDPGCPCPKCRA